MRTRKLSDLYSVGPATVRDLQVLGINSVDKLKRRKAESLYKALCTKTNAQHDPCVIDVFRAAIEQAKDPDLSPEKSCWWYWSNVRKQGVK